MKQCLVFALFLSMTYAQAAELRLSFIDDSQVETSSLVVNRELQGLHSQLEIFDHLGGATPGESFPVGSGQHGEFSLATYAQFSVGGDLSGNIIRLDTNQFPILEVTSFNLATGWILEPQGTAPLTIYSQGDVTIDGLIDCSGGDGGDAVGATPGAGGLARCNGGDGGSGGLTSSAGQNGFSPNPAITGGQGGGFPAASNGGGGGSWKVPSLPNTGGPVAGAAGTSSADPQFTIIAGSAGGGGGSGTAGAAGSGGGAGGGAVVIHAVGDLIVGATGLIDASGGLGGTVNTAGGGGGGGSIKIFVGGNVEFFNAPLSANADFTPGVVNGGSGRSWVASLNYKLLSSTGSAAPGPQVPVVENDPTVRFSSGAQQLETISFDLSTTKVLFNSVTTVPVSSDFSIEVKGSDDDFVSDDTGWTTNLSLLTNKRYVKARVTINTSTPLAPTILDEVVINFTPQDLNAFEFTSVGCGSIGSPHSGDFLFLLLLPLFLLVVLRTSSLKLSSH